MDSKYEAVIGLECHAQLLTNSKLFCSCSTRFGEPPNMNTCPVCLGLPGALPVLNLDFNGSGVPLVEMVTAPDLRGSGEAHEYLSRLKQVLEYLNVCDGNMEEGSLRCDANVSIRLKGADRLGTRTELKNINSFRFVQKAIDYEINRQIEVVESGGRVVQETRLWNSTEERTVSMRSKEEAHDYRYFPDPDLPLLVLDADWLKSIQRSMPELPEVRRDRFVRQYSLSDYDAGVLTMTRTLADFFEETAEASGQPKTAAN